MQGAGNGDVKKKKRRNKKSGAPFFVPQSINLSNHVTFTVVAL